MDFKITEIKVPWKMYHKIENVTKKLEYIKWNILDILELKKIQ